MMHEQSNPSLTALFTPHFGFRAGFHLFVQAAAGGPILLDRWEFVLHFYPGCTEGQAGWAFVPDKVAIFRSSGLTWFASEQSFAARVWVFCIARAH